MSIMCMSCLRFKFSPIHWLVRMMGICPGDKYKGPYITDMEPMPHVHDYLCGKFGCYKDPDWRGDGCR